MEIAIGTNKLSESNLFLRCLWAKLREYFGNCGWNYVPFKNGRENTILFGYASLDLEVPVRVSIKYKTKGSISSINFEFDKEVEARILDSIRGCVDAAKRDFGSPGVMKMASVIRPFSPYTGAMSLQLGKYQGEHFQIEPGNDGVAKLILNVPSFDEVDATTVAKRIGNKLMHLMSVGTNYCFQQVNVDAFNVIEVETAVYQIDNDWIDSFSVKDGVILISESIAKLMNDVAQDVESNQLLCLAASHYHHALRLQLESSSCYNMFEEMVSVLCISSLEVAAMIYGAEDKTCPSCGNKVYGLRRRVIDMASRHSSEGVVSFIDNYYAMRSKYLHTGMMLSDRSYSTMSVPTLDTNSSTGCLHQVPHPPVNIIELTSHLLRKTIVEAQSIGI